MPPIARKAALTPAHKKTLLRPVRRSKKKKGLGSQKGKTGLCEARGQENLIVGAATHSSAAYGTGGGISERKGGVLRTGAVRGVTLPSRNRSGNR